MTNKNPKPVPREKITGRPRKYPGHKMVFRTLYLPAYIAEKFDRIGRDTVTEMLESYEPR